MKVKLWLGDAIYGVNDGLAAIFGIIAGVAGFTASHRFLLLSGWFGALASTLSMAAGAWLAARSQNELLERETALLRARIHQNRPEEIGKLTASYEHWGFTSEEAQWITARIAQQPEKLMDLLAREEGIDNQNPRNPWYSFWFAGISTFVGACIPMVPLVLFPASYAFIAAALVSILAHFVVGSVKSIVTMRYWWASGLEMTAVGIGVGLASYGLGLLSSHII